jgi:hypothetical protein
VEFGAGLIASELAELGLAGTDGIAGAARIDAAIADAAVEEADDVGFVEGGLAWIASMLHDADMAYNSFPTMMVPSNIFAGATDKLEANNARLKEDSDEMGEMQKVLSRAS